MFPRQGLNPISLRGFFKWISVYDFFLSLVVETGPLDLMSLPSVMIMEGLDSTVSAVLTILYPQNVTQVLCKCM